MKREKVSCFFSHVFDIANQLVMRHLSRMILVVSRQNLPDLHHEALRYSFDQPPPTHSLAVNWQSIFFYIFPIYTPLLPTSDTPSVPLENYVISKILLPSLTNLREKEKEKERRKKQKRKNSRKS